MRQKKSFSDEGFTLLELIVTVVAVGILAALVVIAR
jgi:prepilin-type N-terminal cleavage/methylation domain-containing protein